MWLVFYCYYYFQKFNDQQKEIDFFVTNNISCKLCNKILGNKYFARNLIAFINKFLLKKKNILLEVLNKNKNFFFDSLRRRAMKFVNVIGESNFKPTLIIIHTYCMEIK